MITVNKVFKDLITYYDFNQTTGSSLLDRTKNEYNGTLINTPSWVAGKFGNALNFNGSNQAVQNTHNYDIGVVSISFWFKATVTTGQQMLVNKFLNTSNGWGVRINAGNVEIFDDTGNNDTSLYPTAISAGQWYHCVAVIAEDLENKFYIDGNLVGSGSFSDDNWRNFIGDLWLAQRGNASEYFNGQLDDMQIYERELTQTEITFLSANAGNLEDISDVINWPTLKVSQNLTSQVDRAEFMTRYYGDRDYKPAVDDELQIKDGSTIIFGGSITDLGETVEAAKGVVYNVKLSDYQFDLENRLVAESYEGLTIKEIIEDIIDNYAPSGFTTDNVISDFVIDKIVFNQVPITACLRRLSNIVKYEWFVDPEKDLHFFPKFTVSAPYDLEDDSGNYVYKSLKRKIDGTQIANQVLVRGGEFDGATFTDIITVSGDNSKSFNLPYKFDNLTVELDTGSGFVSQTVGIDNIDDFTTKDVLFNFEEKIIRWENPLADADEIRFSGNPKIPVLAISSDSVSIARFGLREKIIRDTTIEDLDVARQRAIAELETYASEVSDINFKTYTSGLRTGMVINVDSVERDFDLDFIIHKVVFQTLTPTEFSYNVRLITTRRYGLIELLRSLVEPESVQANDAEVGEIIKTDIQTVTITEFIEAVTAVTDIQSLTIVETINKDPLGPDTEPIWVLAKHVPSPWPTDPKREGRLTYTMTLY